MNKKVFYKLLRELSKEVCLVKCPFRLIECPKDCKFQKLLIRVLEELDK
jgi:hypothetical protein